MVLGPFRGPGFLATITLAGQHIGAVGNSSASYQIWTSPSDVASAGPQPGDQELTNGPQTVSLTASVQTFMTVYNTNAPTSPTFVKARVVNPSVNTHEWTLSATSGTVVPLGNQSQQPGLAASGPSDRTSV